MRTFLKKFVAETLGQDIVEYALLVFCLALVTVAIFMRTDDRIKPISVTVTLSVRADGGGGYGTVNIADQTRLCSGNEICVMEFKRGAEITLVESPNGGSKFDGWSGDCAGQATSCKLVMNGDKKVLATFQEEK